MPHVEQSLPLRKREISPSGRFLAIDFKIDRKGSKLATFDLVLPSGMILRGCTLMESSGRRWVGLPARSYKKSDGSDAWFQVVDFADRSSRERFAAAALAAALETYDGQEATA
jgi:hypothetical protein